MKNSKNDIGQLTDGLRVCVVGVCGRCVCTDYGWDEGIISEGMTIENHFSCKVIFSSGDGKVRIQVLSSNNIGRREKDSDELTSKSQC